jgi:hypothetical protein
MHAILIVTKMDSKLHARQRQELEERIVPFVKQHSGFVSGTWMYDVAGGRASSMIVLDTEEGARALAEAVRAQTSDPNAAAHGVALESIVVGEVQAQARR